MPHSTTGARRVGHAGEVNELIIAAFGGKVFGVDAATGAPRWKVEVEWTSGPVELIVTRERVVALTGRWILLLERETGRALKKVERKDNGAGARPVALVDGPHLFIGSAGALCCYTLDGEFLWDQPFKGEGLGVVALGVPGNVRQADDRGSK
jgi:outer membrane protein assembly factor BamB